MIILTLISGVLANLLEQCYLDKFSLGDNEIKVMNHYDLLIPNSKFDYECLELLIEKGYYKVALNLYENYFVLNRIDVNQRIGTFLKQSKYANQLDLQTIYKLAMDDTHQVVVVQPSVQWAQTKNQTYLNIKFSHRQDAPACLNCKLELVEIKNKTLLIEAFGVVSHVPIRYRYSIELFKNVIPEQCNYKMEAVGTMALNLTKTDTGIWIRLTEEDYKTPIWWDLRDNIGRDMNEFIQLLEAESERKEKKAEKSYKKAQQKRDKERQIREQAEQVEQKRQWDYEHNQCYKIGKCELGWYQRQ